MKLSGIVDAPSPRIISQDGFGTVRIAFPDGDVYEYVTNDTYRVNELKRRYGRNMGRFVAKLKEFTKGTNGTITKVR